MEWEPGASYRILYQSESGRRAYRTIDVQELRRRNGLLYLRAWCHLRGEERTFRSDRVILGERLGTGRPPDTASVPTCSSPGGFSASLPFTPPAPLYRTPAPPAPAAIARTDTPISSDPAQPGSGSIASSLWNLLKIILALALFGGMASNLSSHRGGSASSSPAWRPPAAIPAPKPAPPRPAMEETVLAGRILRTIRSGGRERFEVPSLGLTTFNKLEAVAAIRVPNFRSATGLTDRALEARYLAADLNRSGKLAFEELKSFQEKTWREFCYEENEPALRPDQFLAAGGGDCEDFALYTAGLLRFWGWEPYLGILAASRSAATGHAVCLSYEEGSFPGSYTWFQIEAWTSKDGTHLKPGRYVPIDYDQVGSLTNAVSPGWKLQEIYVPEAAWGRKM